MLATWIIATAAVVTAAIAVTRLAMEIASRRHGRAKCTNSASRKLIGRWEATHETHLTALDFRGGAARRLTEQVVQERVQAHDGGGVGREHQTPRKQTGPETAEARAPKKTAPKNVEIPRPRLERG